MIQKLIKIQSELKAPKNQFNSFGLYKYRSCEDVLEAVKPLCYAQGLLLTLTDKIIHLENEFFMEATALITDGEMTHAVTALAGIDLSKKGMDKSQSVGSSSSYARKYALNGLFLIDDTKDSDSTNNHGKSGVVTNTTTEMAYLKKDTAQYLNVVKALKEKRATLDQVKTKFVLSSEMESELMKIN
jgi:hypothetical protein